VLIGMAMFGGLASLPLYLQIVKGASPTKAGLLLLPLTLGIMAGSIISGQIISRTGRYRRFPIIGSALLAIALFVPRTTGGAEPAPNLGREVRVLGRQAIYLSLALIVVAMIGQFSLFSYIAPLLITVTGIPERLVPWLLLLFGLGSTAGVLLGGRLADWKLMPTLIGMLLANALIYAVLGLVVRQPLAMAVAIFLWGGTSFAFGAPAQTRVLRWASDAPNLASPLIPTAFNIGIALGATIGSLGLDHGLGYAALPWIGVVVSLASLAIALVSWSLERRSPEPAAC